MFKSIFETPELKISDSAKVIVVADMFIEDYVGGAELTTQALFDESPYEIQKIHSKDLTIEHLKDGFKKFWVFGNFTQINSNLIPSIVANLNYTILEYDFKYCGYRSPEKHLAITGLNCNCAEQLQGKMISAFYHGAKALLWMSEKQMEHYHKLFPFLNENINIVLSSVFSKETLGTIKLLRSQNPIDSKNDQYIVLGSNSWIKGANQAEQWCKDNNKPYKIVWDLSYDELLLTLAQSRGFVYLPLGMDTCPRMVIEAKLLGCELKMNDHVLHNSEDWFQSNDLESIESYLYATPGVFWNAIKKLMDHIPTVSGYTTTRNCISQGYPYIECIKSMLGFCDEVNVVDGGSTDGTWGALNALAAQDSRLKIKQVIRDWNHPRFSVFDGAQKAEAKAMCTKEFFIQLDADEIIHENDYEKYRNIINAFPKGIDLIALPVVEYWSSIEKIRIDVNPWKWRLGRNKKNITHGIPRELRVFDNEGNLYSLPGSDGCDFIDSETFERIQFMSFYNQEVHDIRIRALNGDNDALMKYENWFNQAIEQLPGVTHYSWIDIERKIRLYRDTWSKHWQSLFNQSIEDTPENNMFFDVKWSDVTEEMIIERAKELSQIGGWVFHQKCDGTRMTPWITVKRDEPLVMKK